MLPALEKENKYLKMCQEINNKKTNATVFDTDFNNS